MRNVEFSTNKGEYFLVDFPEGANRFNVFNDRDNPYVSYFKGNDTGRLYVNYPLVLLGDPREFTIIEWHDIVDEFLIEEKVDLSPKYTYKDYIDGIEDAEDYWDEYIFDTATESGLSLLKANGISLPEWKNPIMFKIKE